MGSNIPLTALAVNAPPDALGNVQKLMAIKSMMGQQALQPGQQQLQQGQEQLQQQQIQEGQFAVQDRQAGMKAMQEWDAKDPNDLPDLIRKNGGSLQAVMNAKAAVVKQQTEMAQMNEAQLNVGKTKSDYLLGKLQAATDASIPDEQLPQSVLQATNDSVKAGYMDPQHAQVLQQMTQQYANDPAGLRSHLSLYEKSLQSQSVQFAQAQETQKTNASVSKDTAQASEANAGAAAKNAEATFYQQHPTAGAPGVPAEQVSAADWMAKNPGKTFSDYTIAMKKLVPAFNLSVHQGALTDQAKDMAAENYFQTGQLPSGMRSPVMAGAIMSRAAQLHPNGTTELAGNRAAFEANKKSYDNVTGTLDTLSSFEQSGLKNLKQFTDLASKLPDTGVPWLNTPVRNLNQNLVGAQYMPAIEAARGVALREIARVTNDPKLSGSLTDSARGEVSNFSPENATLPQIKHVVEVLQNDMANVHTSLAQQKADIGGRLGIKASSAQAGAGGSGSKYTPPAGAPSATGANGHKIVVDGGKWVDAETGAPI